MAVLNEKKRLVVVGDAGAGWCSPLDVGTGGIQNYAIRP